jgi:2,3-bisphosphoglycerate-independent phosphoglycerate mutase
MKHVVLVCEGMSDEPLEELSGRTPLEVAKIPNISALAKRGKVGAASFVPASLSARSDVACLSILGYDPKEFYTGIAPLEALSRDIVLGENSVAFRSDLVTVSDDTLIDNSASLISATEAQLLINELNKNAGAGAKFYLGEGYKNLLVISDAENAENLDELECSPPIGVIGQKFAKSLPKGAAAATLIELIRKSKEILENHEINRVRIDLGENPANMIWPWGQGKKPKMPSFKQRYHQKGVVLSRTHYVRGLGKALGFGVAVEVSTALRDNDFLFVFMEANAEIYRSKDLKSKIKLIEDFDAKVVGPALKDLEGKPHRVLVTTDCSISIQKKSIFHGHVPFVMAGEGIEASESSFNEKTANQSKFLFEEGHRLMEVFLKK